MTGPAKDSVAKALAAAHKEMEPSIRRIVRLLSRNENDELEPVKLLEVNPDTPPSGIWPIAFGPNPPKFPFPSVVVEVTEQEYEDIVDGRFLLPNDWRLGETLYPNAA